MGAERRVRTAVIGAGVMGSDHARNLCRNVPGARLAAVTDVDGRRAASLASELDVRAETSATAVIEDPDVDAIIIATHDSTHVALTLQCLDAGKPVLCEKPLSLDVQGCQQIVAHERAALVSVGFSRRFDPLLLELKRSLEEGAIGRPLLAHAVHRNVAAAPEGDSASTIFNSGIHELDQTAWLLGSPIKEVSWQAPGSTRLLPGRQDPQLVLLRTEDGVLTTVELFINSTFGYEVGLEVIGEQGALRMDSPATVLVSRGLASSRPLPADWRLRYNAAYIAEARAWIDGILGQPAQNLATAADGLAATLAAHAVVASMHADGRWIEVNRCHDHRPSRVGDLNS